MPTIPLVGPTYSLPNVSANAQRTINWYPEIDESGMGKAQATFVPTPGAVNAYNLLEAPTRGLLSHSTDLVAVAGGQVLSIEPAVTSRGLVVNDGAPASLASSGTPGHQVL